ncbi:MAG: hypothetical protein J6B56_05350 [Clostridia bacterium]|nr:hypothetical protein [Clostridia bacterium]
MKKRISILATVALCITVGSVYATWTYAQEAANALTDVSINKTLESESLVEKGDIELVENKLNLIVDKKSDSYQAKLICDGYIEVTFKPHDLASVTEINLQYEITGDNLEYEGANIFNLPASAVQSNGAVKTWRINCADLGITMGNITLPTYDDYKAFKTAFEAVSLKITFSEVAGATE